MKINISIFRALISVAVILSGCTNKSHFYNDVTSNTKDYLHVRNQVRILSKKDNLYKLIIHRGEVAISYQTPSACGKAWITGTASEIKERVQRCGKDADLTFHVVNFMKDKDLYCIIENNHTVEFWYSKCCPHERLILGENVNSYLESIYGLNIDSLAGLRKFDKVPAAVKISDSAYLFKIVEDL